MELETKMTLWLSAEEAKALNDWENNLDPNQTSGTPLDIRQKIIDAFLENLNRQWDIDQCYKESKGCEECGVSHNQWGKPLPLFEYSSACDTLLCYECMEEFKA